MATPTARDETRTKITGRGVLTGATALVVTTLRKNITFNCTANTHIIMLLLFYLFSRLFSAAALAPTRSGRPSRTVPSYPAPPLRLAGRTPDTQCTPHRPHHTYDVPCRCDASSLVRRCGVRRNPSLRSREFTGRHAYFCPFFRPFHCRYADKRVIPHIHR